MLKRLMFMVKNYGRNSVFVGVFVLGLGLIAFESYKAVQKNDHHLSGHNNPIFDLNALKNKQNLVSIAIIGSGPAGMMAGVYGARALRDTLIFEGDKPGGLLMDTTDVENWPGESAINGQNIMDKLHFQAENLGVFFLPESIESVDLSQWPYTLVTDNGTQIHALTVIIATGATPKRLEIPGEEENWGSGVSSCAVCDAAFFKGRDVMVVGGGDSAVEEAIQLSPYVKNVTIMVRKEAMRAAGRMQDRLKNYTNIQVCYNVELQEILSDGKGFVTSVIVYNNKETRRTTVAIDGVFLAIGHNPNTEIFKEQLTMDQEGHILVNGRTQKTSVAGVFAAGDVEDTMYRQAGVAAASGIKAALDADQFLASVGITKAYMDSLKERLFVSELAALKNSKIAVFKTLKDLEAQSFSDNTVMLILFYSNDCNNCVSMVSLFQEYAQNVTHNRFGLVNSDEAPELVEHFFVHKVPCVFAFKNGELVGRCNGLITKKQLQEFVDSLQG